MGVKESLESKEGAKDEFDAIGAGDQGMMFGYASDETPVYMPLAIFLAHKLTRRLAEVRKERILDYILPDGKAQVTVMYEDDKPKKITSLVLSTQHLPSVDIETLRLSLIHI